MADLLELGLTGADKIVDKHFDKIPDKYVNSRTYHPKNIPVPGRRKSSRDSKQGQSQRRRSLSNSPSPTSTDSATYYSRMDRDDRPRGFANTSPQFIDDPFTVPPSYSHEPLHQRSEYIPSPPPIGAAGNASRTSARYPDQQVKRTSAQGRAYDDDDDDYRYSRSTARRPAALRRRSSSYHGPRGNEYFDERRGDGMQMEKHRRRGSHTDVSERQKDKSSGYGLKDEVKGQFSNSKEGLAGGALGAVIGGWAAHKAIEARGKEKSDSDDLFKLLGAAVGGLAVNSVVDKWEDNKKDTKGKQEKWDKRWDVDGDGKGDRRSGKNRDKALGKRQQNWDEGDDRRYYR